jgi:hypothetical protein
LRSAASRGCTYGLARAPGSLARYPAPCIFQLITFDEQPVRPILSSTFIHTSGLGHLTFCKFSINSIFTAVTATGSGQKLLKTPQLMVGTNGRLINTARPSLSVCAHTPAFEACELLQTDISGALLLTCCDVLTLFNYAAVLFNIVVALDLRSSS